MDPEVMQTAVLMVLESTFPVRGGGGAENQVATLSAGLIALGIPVSVVVPRTQYGPQGRDERYRACLCAA